MNDLITLKEYAEIVGAPYRTVQTRARQGQIPTFRIGNAVMIDRNTPWLARKMGKPTNADRELTNVSKKSKYRVQITRAYYVAVVDNSGKELMSDFTFMDKKDAERLGAKMKKEIENRGE